MAHLLWLGASRAILQIMKRLGRLEVVAFVTGSILMAYELAVALKGSTDASV